MPLLHFFQGLLTVWCPDPCWNEPCGTVGLSERQWGGCGLQVHGAWQQQCALPSTASVALGKTNNCKCRTRAVPIQSDQQMEDMCVWRDLEAKSLLVQESKGEPSEEWGDAAQHLVPPAVQRTPNEPRHLCFVKLNSHSKVVSVPSVPFYLSCGLHELHHKINTPAKVFWKVKC